MRVKICGITSVADALAAAEAGADAIGLNFVGGPRQVDVPRAREILQQLPPLVTPVALAELEEGRLPDPLLELLGEFWVSHLQVYGDVTAESLVWLRETGLRPMPVLRVKDAEFAAQPAGWVTTEGQTLAFAIVLDAHDPRHRGGTGKAFPWGWVARARQAGQLSGWPPIILAGGLRPENVAEAIDTVQPYAVDVSSGVEVDGEPGRKDRQKMREFVRIAKATLTQAPSPTGPFSPGNVS